MRCSAVAHLALMSAVVVVVDQPFIQIQQPHRAGRARALLPAAQLIFDLQRGPPGKRGKIFPTPVPVAPWQVTHAGALRSLPCSAMAGPSAHAHHIVAKSPRKGSETMAGIKCIISPHAC